MLMMTPPMLVIFDRHPLYRAGLVQAARRVVPTATIVDHDHLADANLANTSDEHTPALVIIGRQARGQDLRDRIAKAQALYPNCPIIGIADPTESTDTALVGLTNASLLPRRATLAEMSAAIERALPARPKPDGTQGDRTGIDALTPAQRRVLVGLMNGRLNKQIAHEMQISEATVKAHVTAVFRKLGVRNRTQAVIAAGEMNMSPAE